MNLRDIVIADLQEFILIDPFVPAELRTSLKIKERVPAFVDRLVAEITAVERQGIIIDRQKIKGMVYDCTKMFVHMLKIQVDQAQMSDIARSQEILKAEGDPILKKFDDNGNADLTEEFGIKITDKS